MPVIVEDGTNVPAANSYVSLAEARAYAGLRGLNLPVSDIELSSLLVRSTDYLDTFKYKGAKTSASQSLEWPRSRVYLLNPGYCNSGELLPSDSIPQKLKSAQIEAAIGLFSGINPMANFDGSAQIIEEQIDVLKVRYANPVEGDINRPVITAVEALLIDLLDRGSVGSSVMFTRV